MSQISTRCFVLRLTDYSETSYVLLLLSKEHGLFSAIAKGAKRPKNRFSSVFGLLNEFDGEFSKSANSELWTVVEAKPVEFHLLKQKYSTVQLLSAAAELYQQSIIHEDEAGEFYVLLEKYLRFLPTIKKNGILIFWRFLTSYLKLNGIPLSFEICPHCSTPLTDNLCYSYSLGGFVCQKCRQNDGIVSELMGVSSEDYLSSIESDILKKLPTIGNYIDEISIPQSSIDRLNKLFLHYISFHFHKKFHLNSLKGFR